MLALMDRHIGRTVLATTMMVLLAFLGLMTIFALIDELGGSRETYGCLARRFNTWPSPPLGEYTRCCPTWSFSVR